LSDGSSAGDWRLPTKTELMAMVASARKQWFKSPALTNRAGTGKWTEGDPFANVQSNVYWSGSTFSSNGAGAWGAWYVQLFDGLVYYSNKSNYYYVWPVRAGQ
jgi:hypothetical protein